MTDPSDTTLVVDMREPDPVRFLSMQHPDVGTWTEETISAADLIVNGVGFERKTPADFASSILDRRIDEQVSKLTEAYDNAYVLIEGDFAEFEELEHTGIRASSLRGKVASITSRHGLPVVATGSGSTDRERHRRLIDMAVRLGRKHTEPPSSAHLPTGSLGTDEPSGKQMWACLPKIGPTLADRLYDSLGAPTTHDWLNLSSQEAEEMLVGVDGIGEATARRLLGTLREEVAEVSNGP